jgi:hypothetical protein
VGRVPRPSSVEQAAELPLPPESDVTANMGGERR